MQNIECLFCKNIYKDKKFIKTKDKVENGADYFYSLWHFNINICPKCRMLEKNNTYNLKIKVPEINVSKELINILSSNCLNCIKHYLSVGEFYKNIDELLQAKCLLMVYDCLYKEINESEILDDSNQIKINIIKSNACLYYDKAITILNRLINVFSDADFLLFFGGILLDGHIINIKKGKQILNDLYKRDDLSALQIDAIKFLLKE